MRGHRPRDKATGQRLLSELGMTSDQEIVDCCENPDEQSARQIKACLAAEHLGIRAAVPGLIRLLATDDIQLLEAASRALWMIGSHRSTLRLVSLIRDSKREDVRRCAVYAIGMLADRRAKQTLCHLLTDQSESEGIRTLAAEALLGLRPRRETIRALIDALRDPSPSVRYSALNTLGIVAKQDVARVIREHLSDQTAVPGLPVEEGTVGRAAQSALDNLERRRRSPSDTRASGHARERS